MRERSWTGLARHHLIGFALFAGSMLVACSADSAGRWRDDSAEWAAVDFAAVDAALQRAAAAYDSPSEIRARFGAATWVSTVRNTDVQVFHEVVADGTRQWVAIRGTANLANALRDLDYEKTTDPVLGIWLHRGIAEDARACLELIRPRLRPDLPVAITGHSLGGGIAALIAAWLADAGYSVERTVTFGQPMLTNETGAKRLDSLSLVRIVDYDDVVPLLPAPTLLSELHGEFRQFGPEVRLAAKSGFEYLKIARADRRIASDFWDHLGHESLADHHVALYTTKIEALVREQQRRRSLAARP